MTESPKHQPLVASFTKSQVSSAIATILDFVVYVCLVEFAGVWYVTSAAVSAVFGALMAFLLGRHWSFKAQHGCVYGQGSRFFAVSGLSLVLNALLIYALTDGLGVHYVASKVVVSVLVGVFINFPLQRHYVFR